MPDEPLLREKARAAIREGRISVEKATRTWGGPGIGAECAICLLRIPKQEMEMEVEFGQEAQLTTFHAHLRCFAAWELERGKPGVAAPEGPQSR